MDRRTVIAFVLMAMVTFLYFGTRPKPAPPAPAQASDTEAVASGQETPKPLEAPAEAIKPTADVPQNDEIATDDSSLKYTLLWTNHGGGLRQVRLKDYPEKIGSREGVLILDEVEGKPATLALVDSETSLPLDTTNFELVESSLTRIAFAANFSNGLQVLKEYFPKAGSYELGVKITLKNSGQTPIQSGFDLVGAQRVPPQSLGGGDVEAMIGQRLASNRIVTSSVSPRKVKSQPYVLNNDKERPIAWIASADRYFAVALQADGEKATIEAAKVVSLPEADRVENTAGRETVSDNIETRLQFRKHLMPPGEELTQEFKLYMGPLSRDVLARHPDLEKMLSFGFFGFFSKLLFWILKGFYQLIPNYGVGILLLTLFVRVCMFPLSRKSQISMARMQKLQPILKELQEKHKADKQRQGKEVMDLYKRHNANPMSGCLPMFLQMPVLIGLYTMLQRSIELRQAPFFWWITDLSHADLAATVVGFPIRILPILMIVSWVVQQMTMPKPADPQQAQTQKMMMFMPIIFGVMMYGVASGLVLYWLTSTTCGIIEQRIIKAQIRHMEARGDFAGIAAEAANLEKKASRRK